MKKLPLLTSAIVISLGCITASCGNTDKAKQNDDKTINAVINNLQHAPDTKGDNTCLLQFQNKYDALISEADVLTATGFVGKIPETKYNKILKNPEHHEFLYKFKNGRLGKIPGLKQEMEIQDVVAIRSIKSMSLNDFKRSYRAITDDEMQVAKDALNEIAEGNSGNADAHKAMEQAKKLGVDKEQVKKTGGVLTDAFKEVSKGYRTVEGLGNAACWNVVTNELIVLQNGVKFEIRTDLGNDTEKNKSVAIALAKIILGKCK